MYFANGVALSKNEDFLLINETYRFQIRRYWLTGEKAGSNDIFIANLPGFPDNLAADKKGTFWLALPSLRKPNTELMLDKPWLKNLIAKLPATLLPKPTHYGMVLQLDENGTILQSLQDPSGDHLTMITSVKPYKDNLFFGSLENDRIGMLPVPVAKAQ